MSKRALVIGGSGEVGKEVVRALRDRGAAVRALVRSSPVPDTEAVSGDLSDRASLERALDGCDAAVFITPHHAEEAHLGQNVIDASHAAGLRRLVYISAFHPSARSLFVQRMLDGIVGVIGPHYRAKLQTERSVRAATALSPVALLPSNFYQNDELALPEILAGSYPQPLGQKRANRVDTRDIGDAAARAILDDIASGAYPLVGPDGWSGAACARVWSEALGRPVAYAGDDIGKWRMTVGARMADARANDFAKTYKVIQRFGVAVSKRTLAQTTELLGRPPRAYRDYVNERAKAATGGGRIEDASLAR